MNFNIANFILKFTSHEPKQNFGFLSSYPTCHVNLETSHYLNVDTSVSNFENKTAFLLVVDNHEVRRVTAET